MQVDKGFMLIKFWNDKQTQNKKSNLSEPLCHFEINFKVKKRYKLSKLLGLKADGHCDICH